MFIIIIWVLFLLGFLLKFILVPHKLEFMRHNVLTNSLDAAMKLPAFGYVLISSSSSRTGEAGNSSSSPDA